MDTPLEQLREMFAGRDAESIVRALLRAQGNIEAATDMILAEIEEEESVPLLEQQELEQRQRQQHQQQHNRTPAPLVLKPDSVAAKPPILRPQLLSPSSSADSFGALTISDHDDAVDNDWNDDDDIDGGEDVPMLIEQHRRHHQPQPQPQLQLDEDPLPHNHQVDEYLAGVLTIFPDACPEHINKLYRENLTLQGPRITDFIANKLAEDGYPRVEQEPKPGLKRKRPVAEEDTGKDYEAEDREREVNPEYLDFVRLLLRQEFPTMPVTYINKIVAQKRNFLAAAYAALLETDRTYDSTNPKPYRKLNQPRKLDNLDGREKMGKIWTKVTDELEWARNKARQAKLKKQTENDAKIAAELNEKEYEENNMLMECACCFGDYPFDRMTHCNELHFFCLDCARKNAENEIGNGRYKLSCMDGSGCKTEFSRTEILRFLDKKALEALAKIEQEDALRIAEIDGFVSCPFCDWGAICAPVEEDRVFTCQKEGCMKSSCRLCKQISHIPQTCEEFAKENKLSVRHTVEEAMTEAMVRKCKKCSYPYIKEYGCNKIHCNRCNTLQCYICQETIKNYDHFNDPARGGKLGNCPLFDNTDQRHEQEIQAAAKKAVEKLKEKDPDLKEEDLQIQVSDSVKKAEQARVAQFQAANPGINAYRQPAQPAQPARPAQAAGLAQYIPDVVHRRGAPLAQRIREHMRNGPGAAHQAQQALLLQQQAIQAQHNQLLQAQQNQALQAQHQQLALQRVHAAQLAARAAAGGNPQANQNHYDPYMYEQVQAQAQAQPQPQPQPQYRGFPKPDFILQQQLAQQQAQLEAQLEAQQLQPPNQVVAAQQAQYRGVLHRRPQAPNPAVALIGMGGRLDRPDQHIQQAINAQQAFNVRGARQPRR